jgi:hypothetical protein
MRVGSDPLIHFLYEGEEQGEYQMTEAKKKMEEIMGPVDYLVVLFPGNKFSGKIVPELNRLQNDGIIHVVDLVFIHKDARGKVAHIESKDLGGEAGDAFSKFAHRVNEWLSLDDIDAIGASLPKNSSAAALLFENSWAVRFKKALLDADAQLLMQGRIPGELIQQVIAEKGGN